MERWSSRGTRAGGDEITRVAGRRDYLWLVGILVGCGLTGYYLCGRTGWSTVPSERINLRLRGHAAVQGGYRRLTPQEEARRVGALHGEPALAGLVPAPAWSCAGPIWADLCVGGTWQARNVSPRISAEEAERAKNYYHRLTKPSFAVLNPFVLASLDATNESFGDYRDAALERCWVAAEVPQEAVFDGARRTLTLRYLIPADLVRQGLSYHLNLLNARDLGLEAFSIRRGSRGLRGDLEKVCPIDQRYTTPGVPCASGPDSYPEDGAPIMFTTIDYGTAQTYRLETIPARIHIDFWSSLQGAAQDQPTFSEIIQVTPSESLQLLLQPG